MKLNCFRVKAHGFVEIDTGIINGTWAYESVYFIDTDKDNTVVVFSHAIDNEHVHVNVKLSEIESVLVDEKHRTIKVFVPLGSFEQYGVTVFVRRNKDADLMEAYENAFNSDIDPFAGGYMEGDD